MSRRQIRHMPAAALGTERRRSRRAGSRTTTAKQRSGNAKPPRSSQFRIAYRLIKATPGLPIYLTGGVLVWAATRALDAAPILQSELGSAIITLFRLIGLVCVVVLYFRRTGQLAGAIRDAACLRTQLRESGTVIVWPALRRGLLDLIGHAPQHEASES